MRFEAKAIAPAERAGNLIAHEIRRAIIEGRVQPGDVLREEEIARELGTSRTPVREALIELRNEGLVEAQATRRSVVRSYTLDELDDIYRLRSSLEAHAARLAAERATPATIRELNASLRRFQELADGDQNDHLDELISENLAFHAIIASTASVSRLQAMIDQVMILPRRYRSYASYDRERRQIVAQHHQAITDAIVAGDATLAAQVMGDHVLWTGTTAVNAQSDLDASE